MSCLVPAEAKRRDQIPVTGAGGIVVNHLRWVLGTTQACCPKVFRHCQKQQVSVCLSLQLLTISPAHQLLYFLVYESGSHYVPMAGLELYVDQAGFKLTEICV